MHGHRNLKFTLNVTPLAAVSNILLEIFNTAVECKCISFLHTYTPYMHVPDDRLLKVETSWKYVNVCTEIHHNTGTVLYV